MSARLCLQADGLEQIESFFLRRVGIGVHGEGRGVVVGVKLKLTRGARVNPLEESDF